MHPLQVPLQLLRRWVLHFSIALTERLIRQILYFLPLRQALTVADHIRRAVMSKELKKKSTGEILGRVTVSIGVSLLQPGDDMDSLIGRADACLYAAKRNSRNRVICEVDPEYSAEIQVQVA